MNYKDTAVCLVDALTLVIPQIPVVRNESKYVVYGPLSEVSRTPDVVLLFADARQGLIVTEAVQYVDAGIPPALGRPACAVIPQAMNTGRAALSLGCCGARAYLNILKDDVALWALPGARLEEYATQIATFAHANDTLRQSHSLRMQDMNGGQHPSYQESLSRLQATT